MSEMQVCVDPVLMSGSRGFSFAPMEWVVVTFCGLNYRGRVEECRWKENKDAYWVAYVGDGGDIKTNEFSRDELSAIKE